MLLKFSGFDILPTYYFKFFVVYSKFGLKFQPTKLT